MTQGFATLPPAPRANPDLIGHAEAEATLLDAALSSRMPHAWLLGGPPGIGKATLAFRFARFMLSGGLLNGAQQGGALFGGRPASLHVDPEDPAFRRVRSGGHGNLLTIERPWHKDDEKKDEADRRRRVDDLPVGEVRRIAPFLQLTTAEDGWRVVVVDEAERMNRHAANALLKVLEEPPPRSLLLLVSNNPGALLPTIRSRCRRLTLEPLPEQDVLAFLERHAPDLAANERLGVTRLAEGSIGRAVALVQEGGLGLYRTLYELLESLPRLDVVQAHKVAERFAPATVEPAYRLVVELLNWWLERLIRGVVGSGAAAEIVPGEAALLARLAGPEGSGLDRWLEVWEKTHRLFAQADSANLDRKQVLLQAFLALETAARAR